MQSQPEKQIEAGTESPGFDLLASYLPTALSALLPLFLAPRQ